MSTARKFPSRAPTASRWTPGISSGDTAPIIVRLWVSSINYTDDVPFSEEMFTRLGDTYRRIRNTLRILLGNLQIFL